MFGLHSQSDMNSLDVQTRRVDLITINRQYNRQTKQADIAMMHLQQPLNFTGQQQHYTYTCQRHLVSKVKSDLQTVANADELNIRKKGFQIFINKTQQFAKILLLRSQRRFHSCISSSSPSKAITDGWCCGLRPNISSVTMNSWICMWVAVMSPLGLLWLFVFCHRTRLAV